jgi:hypothetical protein
MLTRVQYGLVFEILESNFEMASGDLRIFVPAFLWPKNLLITFEIINSLLGIRSKGNWSLDFENVPPMEFAIFCSFQNYGYIFFVVKKFSINSFCSLFVT